MGEITWKQIAVMNQHYRNRSFACFLETQRRLGFESLELWMGPPHFYLDRLRCEECRAVRRQVEAYGFQIVSATTSSFAWQYQYAVPDGQTWNFAKDYFKKGIRAAAELGAPIMTVNSGWGDWEEPEADAFHRSADMLMELAETAQREGVVLALESLTSLESKIADTLPKTKRLWETVNHPNLEVMADTVAMGYQGETLKDWFEAFGNHLIHIHFVDMDGTKKSDDHLIWGDGGFSLEKMGETLDTYGYRGYLVQEIAACRYQAAPEATDERNRNVLFEWVKRRSNQKNTEK